MPEVMHEHSKKLPGGVGKGPILNKPASVSQEVERKRKVGSYSKTLIPKTDLAGAWSLGLLSAACIAVFNIMPPSFKG